MSSNEVVIVSAKRTPIGAFLGALAPLSAVQLGGVAAKAAIDSAGIGPAELEEVIIGCVLPAGLGQAPARQAAIAAGVPVNVPATTVNKMCGSALKAVMLAADRSAPAPRRSCWPADSSRCPTPPTCCPRRAPATAWVMGRCWTTCSTTGCRAPWTASSWAASRTRRQRSTVQPRPAGRVRRRVRAARLQAVEAGDFDAEITPVTVKSRKGETVVARDETPGTCDVSKITTLKPAFDKDGTVTAASSSSISDGAAALVLMSAEACTQPGPEAAGAHGRPTPATRRSRSGSRPRPVGAIARY